MLVPVLRAQKGEIIVRNGAAIEGEIDGGIRLIGEGAVILGGEARVRGDVAAKRAASTAAASRLERRAGARFDGRELDEPGFDLPKMPGARKTKGTRAFTVDGSGASPASYADIRDVLVRRNYSPVAIPPGVYGKLEIEGGRVSLGVRGSRLPARYDFEFLSLTQSGRIDVVGPVIVTVGSLGPIDGLVGRMDIPEWFDLRVDGGPVALGEMAHFFGALYAPESRISFGRGSSGTGWVAGNDLSLAANARFRAEPQRWGTRGNYDRTPTFPAQAVLMQRRLPGFTASVEGRFTPRLTYDEDIPMLLLREAEGPPAGKTRAEDLRAFFNACCLLLADTGVQQARIAVLRSGAARNDSFLIQLTREEFLGHLWAVGQEPEPAESRRKIEASPLLLNLFQERIRYSANAKTEVLP